DELLDLLKSLQQGEKGDLPEDLNTCPPDELLRRLLAKMPELSRNPQAAVNQNDVPLGVSGGHERRRSRRRWSKPVEVRITAPMHDKPVHGVIINRSTGGVAILADTDFPADTVLFLRSLEAPPSVPSAKVTVRHSRQHGKLWLTDCQYHEDV